MGLDPDAAGVRVLGTLSMQWIPVSNFTVTPVVAVAERRPVLVPQPSEVAAILEVPLAAFLPGGELLWVERADPRLGPALRRVPGRGARGVGDDRAGARRAGGLAGARDG